MKKLQFTLEINVSKEDAIKRYDLAKKDGKTEFIATLNTPEEYIPYIAWGFPKALAFIKLIPEVKKNEI